jgi:hypothetical protein
VGVRLFPDHLVLCQRRLSNTPSVVIDKREDLVVVRRTVDLELRTAMNAPIAWIICGSPGLLEPMDFELDHPPTDMSQADGVDCPSAPP